MNIVSFVEGAEPPGFVGVPKILASTAAQGHSVVLLMPGHPIFGGEQYIVPDAISAQQRREGKGTFGIVLLKGWSRYRFCPSMVWRFSRLVREADFVSLHSLYSFPVLAGYFLARIHGKPYGFWPHGVLAPFQRTVSAGRKWIYDILFAKRILNNASVIAYSSEGERQETQEMGLRAPSVIAPEGFNAEEFGNLPERGRFRSRFLEGYSGPLVLFLARVNAKKGLDLLIRAMRRVIDVKPDAKLAIVGPFDPPSFKRQVVDWIQENGIEKNTVLTGIADLKMRQEAFADADIYVLPSYAENFGHSIFEAMASGLPIVVSDTLALANVFVAEGTGFTPPRTAEDFSERILMLLDSPETRRQMGIRGRLLARKYSWSETGAKVSSAIESVVEGRAFPSDLAARWPHGEKLRSISRSKVSLKDEPSGPGRVRRVNHE